MTATKTRNKMVKVILWDDEDVDAREYNDEDEQLCIDFNASDEYIAQYLTELYYDRNFVAPDYLEKVVRTEDNILTEWNIPRFGLLTIVITNIS